VAGWLNRKRFAAVVQVIVSESVIEIGFERGILSRRNKNGPDGRSWLTLAWMLSVPFQSSSDFSNETLSLTST
jgi:hypothetical protein